MAAEHPSPCPTCIDNAAQLRRIEALLLEIAGKRKSDLPCAMIRWETAGRSIEKSKTQAYDMVWRYNRDRAEKDQIRTQTGGVHRADWIRFINSRYALKPAYREAIKRAKKVLESA